MESTSFVSFLSLIISCTNWISLVAGSQKPRSQPAQSRLASFHDRFTSPINSRSTPLEKTITPSFDVFTSTSSGPRSKYARPYPSTPTPRRPPLAHSWRISPPRVTYAASAQPRASHHRHSTSMSPSPMLSVGRLITPIYPLFCPCSPTVFLARRNPSRLGIRSLFGR